MKFDALKWSTGEIRSRHVQAPPSEGFLPGKVDWTAFVAVVTIVAIGLTLIAVSWKLVSWAWS